MSLIVRRPLKPTTTAQHPHTAKLRNDPRRHYFSFTACAMHTIVVYAGPTESAVDLVTNHQPPITRKNAAVGAADACHLSAIMFLSQAGDSQRRVSQSLRVVVNEFSLDERGTVVPCRFVFFFVLAELLASTKTCLIQPNNCHQKCSLTRWSHWPINGVELVICWSITEKLNSSLPSNARLCFGVIFVSRVQCLVCIDDPVETPGGLTIPI